jgi:hypothetical protein
VFRDIELRGIGLESACVLQQRGRLELSSHKSGLYEVEYRVALEDLVAHDRPDLQDGHRPLVYLLQDPVIRGMAMLEGEMVLLSLHSPESAVH